MTILVVNRRHHEWVIRVREIGAVEHPAVESFNLTPITDRSRHTEVVVIKKVHGVLARILGGTEGMVSPLRFYELFPPAFVPLYRELVAPRIRWIDKIVRLKILPPAVISFKSGLIVS